MPQVRTFTKSCALACANTDVLHDILPVQVGGYLAMNLTMPSVLSWVLGGNVRAFEGSDRWPYCDLEEKPKAFHEQVLGQSARVYVRMCACVHTRACMHFWRADHGGCLSWWKK